MATVLFDLVLTLLDIIVLGILFRVPYEVPPFAINAENKETGKEEKVTCAKVRISDTRGNSRH